MNLPSTRELIIKLKEVRAEKNLSYTAIEQLMAKNGDSLSRSTISSIFTDGSEDDNFDYEYTIRPVVKALLDTENIEETDNLDVQAMKILLKVKMEKIQELDAKIDKDKIKHLERVEELNKQIALKDQRMDMFIEMIKDYKQTVKEKDAQYQELLHRILNCHCPNRKEEE